MNQDEKISYFADFVCLLNEHICKFIKDVEKQKFEESLCNLSLNIKFDEKGENVSVDIKWE